MAFRQVKPTLEALGFQIGKVTYRDAIGEGLISMSFEGKTLTSGTLLPLMSKIDLVMGNGKGMRN